MASIRKRAARLFSAVYGIQFAVLLIAAVSPFQVKVSVEGPYPGTVAGTEVYPQEGCPGVYQVMYRVTTPATYHISITWADRHLLGSPYTCLIQEWHTSNSACGKFYWPSHTGVTLFSSHLWYKIWALRLCCRWQLTSSSVPISNNYLYERSEFLHHYWTFLHLQYLRYWSHINISPCKFFVSKSEKRYYVNYWEICLCVCPWYMYVNILITLVPFNHYIIQKSSFLIPRHTMYIHVQYII